MKAFGVFSLLAMSVILMGSVLSAKAPLDSESSGKPRGGRKLNRGRDLSGWWSGSKSGKSTPSPTESPTESPTVSPTESPTLSPTFCGKSAKSWWGTSAKSCKTGSWWSRESRDGVRDRKLTARKGRRQINKVIKKMET